MTVLGRASRWTVFLAVLMVLALGATDATAKHGRRGGESKQKHYRVQRHGAKDYKHVARRRTACEPQVVTRYQTRAIRAPYVIESSRPWRTQVVREYRPACEPRPVRVIRYDTRPFYFNAGLNFYFDNATLALTIGDRLPVGYIYHDPVCDMHFTVASAYREHLHHHGHEPLVEVVRDCSPR